MFSSLLDVFFPSTSRKNHSLFIKKSEEPVFGEYYSLVQDLTNRFIVAHADGRIGDDLVDHAVEQTLQLTHGRSLDWCGDGW
jgi:hypothetical protein